MTPTFVHCIKDVHKKTHDFKWIYRLCSVGYGYFLWGMRFVTEVTELSGKGMKVVQKSPNLSG